jgi:hypothetical protein
VVTQLFIRLVIVLEMLTAMLPKDASYSTRIVILYKVTLHSKRLLAMLNVLSVYSIQGTFGQRQIVDAIQEGRLSRSIRAYDKIQLVCKSQLNGGVIFKVCTPKFSKQHQFLFGCFWLASRLPIAIMWIVWRL